MAFPSSTLWQSKPACKGAFCRPVVPLGISYIVRVKKRGERGEGRGERGKGGWDRREGNMRGEVVTVVGSAGGVRGGVRGGVKGKKGYSLPRRTLQRSSLLAPRA